MSALTVTHATARDALVRFAFDDGRHDDAVSIACPRLAGPTGGETWIESLDANGRGEFSIATIEIDEAAFDGIEQASAEAYRHLLAVVRASAHPWLLRIWNYLGDINRGDGDGERYRRFCVGRSAAVDATFNAPPPAATAIGTVENNGRVQVIALCTRTPGIALENPRQTPAWQYPREYGPIAPGFSRGALTGRGAATRLLASGTASIVGHVSRHAGDAAAQARESVENLQALLREGEHLSGRSFALRDAEALRVYLRDPSDLDAVRTVLAPLVPIERVLFLHGDICRRELLVELEGVFAAG